MKYKEGDKVLIKDINWYNKNKDENGDISCGEFIFVSSMSKFCGKILTIDVVFEDGTYLMKEDTDGFVFTNEMFDTFAEEKVERLTGNLSNSLVNEFELPDGYQFKDENGNVINATKIVLEKKKKEYPKTFRECQECLGEDVPPMEEPDSKTHRRRQVHLLEVLLICRDAYWKIAGEEMGLDGPWEPNWEDKIYYVYYERHRQYGIGIKKAYCHCGIRGNRILVFPTKEMVNAFYENFKELIEQCKELL